MATSVRKALEIMHFKRPAEGQPWLKAALDEELNDDGQPLCEAGCYKCLLSYYNQPDHALIDRQDEEAGGLVLEMLCRLTQSEARLGTQGRSAEQHSAELARTAGSTLEHAWLAYVEQHGHRKPDRGQHTIAQARTSADFFYDEYQLAVFIDGSHHAAAGQCATGAADAASPALPCRNCCGPPTSSRGRCATRTTSDWMCSMDYCSLRIWMRSSTAVG
jgi:hypothetical protein